MLISSTGLSGPDVDPWGMRRLLRRVRGARKRLVGAGDGHRGILLLAGCGANVVVLPLVEAGGHGWG